MAVSEELERRRKAARNASRSALVGHEVRRPAELLAALAAAEVPAKRLAAAGLRIVPDPPHTNAFRVFTEEPADDVNDRLLQHLETTHELVMPWFVASDPPGWSWAEFTVGSATCAAGAADVTERVAAMVVRTTP
jgi:hypothetical protein